MEEELYRKANEYYDCGKLEKALEFYSLTLLENPNHDRALYNRGLLQLDLMQFESAIADFTVVIETNPNDSEAYYNRGCTFNRMNSFEPALKDFMKAATLDPEDSDIVFNIAVVLESMYRYAESMEYFTKVISMAPSVDVYFKRAKLYHRMKQNEDAVEDLTKLVQILPGDKQQEVLTMRGNIYMEMGNYEEAEKDYTMVIDTCIPSGEEYFKRALALSRMKKYDKGLEDYNRAIQIEEQPHFYMNRGNVFFFLSNYESSLSDYTKSIEMKPSADNLANRGVLYSRMNEYHKAIEDFTASLKLEKKKFTSLMERGVCYMSLRLYDKATDDFNSCLRLKSESTRGQKAAILNNLGNVFLRKLKFEQSSKYYSEALESISGIGDPENLKLKLSIHQNISVCHFEERNYQKCVNQLNYILENFGASVLDDETKKTLLCNRGVSYFLMKEFSKSIEEFKKLATMTNFKNDIYLTNLGTCYFNLKKFKEAIAWSNRALSVNSKKVPSLLTRACSFAELGDNESALSDLNILLETFVLSAKQTLYCNRGVIYSRMGKQEEAIEDFTMALSELNTEIEDLDEGKLEGVIESSNYLPLNVIEVEVFQAKGMCERMKETILNNRGVAYVMLKKYELARKDFEESIRHSPSSTRSLCDLGCLFSRFGDIEKGEMYFKKAMEENPNDPYVFQERHASRKKYDTIGALEDYAKVLRMVQSSEGNSPFEFQDYFSLTGFDWSHPNIVSMEKRLKKEMDTFESKHWFRFSNDRQVDEFYESEEINEIRVGLKGKEFSDIIIFRNIGRGCFGSVYLCRLKNVGGLFVMKIGSDVFLSSAQKKVEIDRETILFPYHRNVVPILYSSEKIEEIDMKSFPDFSKNWKDFSSPSYSLKAGIILMKHHRKTLKSYLMQRLLNQPHPEKFSKLELISLFSGLISGIDHLHSNYIVHRDLHLDNIFVEPLYGRVWIGDFGLCLDLRNNENGFLVNSSDPLLKDIEGYYKFGGYSKFLAPEIVDGIESVIDFSKSDLFSLGMVYYYVIGSFGGNCVIRRESSGIHKINCFPFGGSENNQKDLVMGRKQEMYQPILEDENVDLSMLELIEKLLAVSPKERIGCVETKECIFRMKPKLEIKKKERKKMKKTERTRDISYHMNTLLRVKGETVGSNVSTRSVDMVINLEGGFAHKEIDLK